jgi:putative transport protein
MLRRRWSVHAVFEYLAAQPVLVTFLLVGLGAVFGRLRIGGVSLGAVAVLFAAIGITAWSVAVDALITIPAVIGDAGLVVFAFATGLIAGPGFFNALRTAYPLMLVVGAVLILAGTAGFLVGTWMGMEPVTIAGTFAGALTNTPALAATGGSAEATVGYASTYVIGIVASMTAVALALRNSASDTDAPAPIVDKQVHIDAIDPTTAADVTSRHGNRVTLGRIVHPDGRPAEATGPDTPLEPGDVVNVIGPRDEVDEVAAELGHTSVVDITRDRSRLDYRRIILSNPRLAGRTIAQLDLRGRFEASIVRVRRGDVDFVGSPDFVLHLGDRLRVVGPTDAMAAVTAHLGDSERGMADINPAALGLGIVLGVLLGMIQIPIGGGRTFALGIAAGTLVVGLVMGRIGRIGPVITTLPNTSAGVLAEYGLLVFLAYAGTKAGSVIIDAISSGAIVYLLLLGTLMSLIAVAGVYLVVRHVFRTGGTRLSGVIGGAQTNPALLGFANLRTGYDVRVALGYSLVYPAAMVVKILIAQVMVEL